MLQTSPLETTTMSQSLAKNLIHLVFSTKERASLIDDDIRPRLHEYAGGILKKLNSPALLMNSVPDHIHLLFNLHKTKSLSDVVKELKAGSSSWIKEQNPRYATFYWQAGYACVFRSANLPWDHVERVYCSTKQSHHSTKNISGRIS